MSDLKSKKSRLEAAEARFEAIQERLERLDIKNNTSDPNFTGQSSDDAAEIDELIEEETALGEEIVELKKSLPPCLRCRGRADCFCPPKLRKAYEFNFQAKLNHLWETEEKHTAAIALLRSNVTDHAANLLEDSVAAIHTITHPAFAHDHARQADPELRLGQKALKA